MFAYVEGFKAGPNMDEQLRKYKKLYKSHRKVGVYEQTLIKYYILETITLKNIVL